MGLSLGVGVGVGVHIMPKIIVLDGLAVSRLISKLPSAGRLLC